MAQDHRTLRQSRLQIHAPEESGKGKRSLGTPPARDHRKAALEKIVARLDQPHTFFYPDPPYYTKEHIYEREYTDAFTQHEELTEALKQIKGKFLLSYNNDPYIKQLYDGCVIDEVETQYSVSGAFQTEIELLIRNYKQTRAFDLDNNGKRYGRYREKREES
ncbi:MAG: DNA adenine methylase [Candidatus Cloacimonetes bacterium]|nr:DNA adenine methylase [Candidatus Cloacimonadota bacterium]